MTNVIIICSVCGKKLSGLGSLKKHIKFKHGDNIIKCNMCDSTSKSHDQLQRHIETKHENVKYSCNSCTYLTTFLLLFMGILRYIDKQCTRDWCTNVTSANIMPAHQGLLDGTRNPPTSEIEQDCS